MYELKVDLIDKGYPIYIERGIFDHIHEWIKKIYSNGKIVVITDDHVYPLYGEKLLEGLKKDFNARCIIIPHGEKSKSMDQLNKIYDELLDFEMTRKDLIITLGGGVVGDLGGFAAATLLRGIPFIQIPTSLLAQIDSSIGGKVAVNLPRGKNLVGAFYHPKAVYIDPNLLDTLPKRFFYDGMAEVIKYGCIKDEALFYRLETYSQKELMNHMEDIIYRCCTIKQQIVQKDEKDQGDRRLLNFGHTLGHGVEKYYKYQKYSHGEAVAIGMYHITKKSEFLGITHNHTATRIQEILKKYHLPYLFEGLDQDEVINTLMLDKKNEGEWMNVVLLKRIGESFIQKIHKSEIKKFM